MFGIVSCSKDDKEDEIDDGDRIEKEDIIGTWTAPSGKYNLTLIITSSDYDFTISEPGRGGSYDRGTYEISDAGKITFVNTSNTVLAMGQLRNGRLALTFVNSIAIMMLGTEAASNTEFILSGDDGTDEEESGFLIVQNLSENNDLVAFYFYDESNNLLDSDSDTLEPGYQFTYEVMTGNYIVKVTDDRGKSFTSKSFKVIKNKATILGYNGSALNVSATGVEKSKILPDTNLKESKSIRFLSVPR